MKNSSLSKTIAKGLREQFDPTRIKTFIPHVRRALAALEGGDTNLADEWLDTASAYAPTAEIKISIIEAKRIMWKCGGCLEAETLLKTVLNVARGLSGSQGKFSGLPQPHLPYRLTLRGKIIASFATSGELEKAYDDFDIHHKDFNRLAKEYPAQPKKQSIVEIIADGLDNAQPGKKGFGIEHLRAVNLANSAPDLLAALDDLGAAIEKGDPEEIATLWLFHSKVTIARARGEN